MTEQTLTQEGLNVIVVEVDAEEDTCGAYCPPAGTFCSKAAGHDGRHHWPGYSEDED